MHITKKQIKFLEVIYNKEITAAELCKKLKIKPNENDTIGGCYNALNKHIDYLTSDDANEIDGMFEIRHCDGPICNNGIYAITSQEKTYIENYNRDSNRYIIQTMIALIAIIVVIVIAIIQIA
ncbi:hypothetical protein LL037_18635 [Clostridium estertheticum]|uniref:hypothetical protein n=1 Tax=Clostridium estertheticum TaxID=238834 RepID=UPI001C0DC3BF|nr:hypothetical protein [Clostridium estertheticum]MBU3200298.1 hypothetical protein [Clostridium estertheticum]WAG64470.1 hypothetical protein LL037_18635 [Clostridium estertheticum]